MTFGLGVWGIVVVSPDVMGNAKLVGVTTGGVWNRRLAKSSWSRSGSGRSASESLLSYDQASCVELWVPNSLMEDEPMPVLLPKGHYSGIGTDIHAYRRVTHITTTTFCHENGKAFWNFLHKASPSYKLIIQVSPFSHLCAHRKQSFSLSPNWNTTTEQKPNFKETHLLKWIMPATWVTLK